MSQLRLEPDVVLVLECSTEVIINRLLNRNQGRVDDNYQTIQRRLQVYIDSTLPVIEYYHSKGKVDGEKSEEEVFEAIKGVFSKLKPGSSDG
ncbi:hypothetical protein RJ639_009329, partial [Escallonia herrerae]